MTTKPNQLGWAILLWNALRWGSVALFVFSTTTLGIALVSSQIGSLNPRSLTLQAANTQPLQSQSLIPKPLIIQVAQDPIAAAQPRSGNVPNYQSILGMMLLGTVGLATNLFHPSRRSSSSPSNTNK